MAIRLTQKEADMLIDMLKRTVEQTIVFPNSKGKIAFDVRGERREDIFVVNIDRKGINAAGASYQGRVRASGVILLRLDINPTAVHSNPDGEKITGTHLHVYTEEHEMGYVLPFDVGNKNLHQLCYSFFERFNIIEPPTVMHQATLF